MGERTQPQQQPRLQKEPPASTSLAPCPPPLPAEREAKQGLEDEGFCLRGQTVGKIPDVGQMEEHTHLEQQQRRQVEPPASTPPTPWPPPFPGLTGGKVPDVGLMEERAQPQQQQRLQTEPPVSTSPTPWPPQLPAEREAKHGLEDEGFDPPGADGGQHARRRTDGGTHPGRAAATTPGGATSFDFPHAMAAPIARVNGG